MCITSSSGPAEACLFAVFKKNTARVKPERRAASPWTMQSPSPSGLNLTFSSILQHFGRASIHQSQDWEADHPTPGCSCNLTFLFPDHPCWLWATAEAATCILAHPAVSDGIWVLSFSPSARQSSMTWHALEKPRKHAAISWPHPQSQKGEHEEMLPCQPWENRTCCPWQGVLQNSTVVKWAN